jgi:hypothetical protein
MSARHDAVELTRRTPGKLCGKPALMYLAGDPNALFTVREEGRRGGRGGTPETARAWTVAAQVSHLRPFLGSLLLPYGFI